MTRSVDRSETGEVTVEKGPENQVEGRGPKGDSVTKRIYQPPGFVVLVGLREQ